MRFKAREAGRVLQALLQQPRPSPDTAIAAAAAAPAASNSGGKGDAVGAMQGPHAALRGQGDHELYTDSGHHASPARE